MTLADLDQRFLDAESLGLAVLDYACDGDVRPDVRHTIRSLIRINRTIHSDYAYWGVTVTHIEGHQP